MICVTKVNRQLGHVVFLPRFVTVTRSTVVIGFVLVSVYEACLKAFLRDEVKVNYLASNLCHHHSLLRHGTHL